MAKLTVSYFSQTLRYVFIVLTIVTTYFLIQNDWWQTLVLLLVANLFILTRKFQIEVNLKTNEIIDKSQAFGIDYQTSRTKFNRLNGIRIDKTRHHYTANSKGKSGVTDYFEYIGSLLYDGGKAYEIRRRISYKAIKNELDRMAQDLDIEVAQT